MRGAWANDPVDGDLTAQIVRTGNVDTNRAGTYTITYSVTNSAGRTVSVTRTVTVTSPAGNQPGDNQPATCNECGRVTCICCNECDRATCICCDTCNRHPCACPPDPIPCPYCMQDPCQC